MRSAVGPAIRLISAGSSTQNCAKTHNGNGRQQRPKGSDLPPLMRMTPTEVKRRAPPGAQLTATGPSRPQQTARQTQSGAAQGVRTLMVRIQQPTLTEVWNPGAIESNATADASALLSHLTDGSKEWTHGTSAMTVPAAVVDPTLARPTGRTPVGGREWYLDSGAARHICGSREHMTDYKSIAPVALIGISSQTLYAQGTGNLSLWLTLDGEYTTPSCCVMCCMCLVCLSISLQ
jgi:hypothetical protein